MKLSRCITIIAAAALLCLLSTIPSQAQSLDEIKKLIDDGWWDDALIAARAQIARHPDDPESNFLLGKACFLTDDFDGAEEYLERAIGLDGGQSEYHYWLGNVKGAKAQTGGVLKMPGRAKACKSQFEKAIALDPGNLDARFNLIQYHMQAPGIIGGDKARARAQADTIGFFDKTKGLRAQSLLAEFIDKDYIKAEDYLRQAIALDTVELDSYFRLGYFLARRDRLNEAESLSFKAQAIDSTNLNIYYSRASIYETQKRYDQAIAQYEIIQQKDSTDLLVEYQIAKMLILADKDPVRAESLLMRYIEARHKGYWPDTAAARWRLAMAYDKQGKTGLAIAELEKGLEQKPRHTEKEMKELLKELKKKR